MAKPENSRSRVSILPDSGAPLRGGLKRVHAVDAAAQVPNDPGALIARQLSGSLTALRLHLDEIKRCSYGSSEVSGDGVNLRLIVESAFQQTQRACGMMDQMLVLWNASLKSGCRAPDDLTNPSCCRRAMIFAPVAGRKPLTRREREVLGFISEGCSSKEGALRMNISPRTFESHRSEIMRKLGARNTVEVVRMTLQHPDDVATTLKG